MEEIDIIFGKLCTLIYCKVDNRDLHHFSRHMHIMRNTAKNACFVAKYAQ